MESSTSKMPGSSELVSYRAAVSQRSCSIAFGKIWMSVLLMQNQICFYRHAKKLSNVFIGSLSTQADVQSQVEPHTSHRAPACLGLVKHGLQAHCLEYGRTCLTFL